MDTLIKKNHVNTKEKKINLIAALEESDTASSVLLRIPL